MTEDRSQVRDKALQTLETIREALTADDIQAAVRQIDVLQGQLVDWKRADAREWLDDALQADLLLFNIEAAHNRLNQWAGTLGNMPDALLEDYRVRVEQRINEKRLALQARGVVAHCHELWRQAEELEFSDHPPHPDRLLDEYYTIAERVAESAALEYPNNPNLAELHTQATSIHEEKRTARNIYLVALQDDEYANALETIVALDALVLVPRFQQITDRQTGATSIKFTGMIRREAAYDEVEALGREWATQHVAPLLQNIHDELVAYQPQAALQLLTGRKQIERFAEAAISAKFQEFEARAQDDIRRLQHAERRAQQAQHLLETNLLGAWDVLTEARNIYAGAPSVLEMHNVILGRMVAKLDGLISQAERAFDERLMENVGQIYQNARLDYSDKAPELEQRLRRLEEIDWEARAYVEHRHNAVQMLEQIRVWLVEDVSKAADMLARLEEDHNAFVLEDLPGLTEIRTAIRRRLNQEMLYNRLYKLLHSDNVEDVEGGMGEALKADEPRFNQLAKDLETHLAYLNGHVEYALGQNRQALVLFGQVARHSGHPDQAEAERLIHEIEAALRPTPPPPAPIVIAEDEFIDDYSDDVDDEIGADITAEEVSVTDAPDLRRYENYTDWDDDEDNDLN